LGPAAALRVRPRLAGLPQPLRPRLGPAAARAVQQRRRPRGLACAAHLAGAGASARRGTAGPAGAGGDGGDAAGFAQTLRAGGAAARDLVDAPGAAAIDSSW